MLSYALRPETWATTRLELEGRGVSWLVSSSSGPTELRSFWWELVPSSTCVCAEQLRWLITAHTEPGFQPFPHVCCTAPHSHSSSRPSIPFCRWHA